MLCNFVAFRPTIYCIVRPTCVFHFGMSETQCPKLGFRGTYFIPCTFRSYTPFNSKCYLWCSRRNALGHINDIKFVLEFVPYVLLLKSGWNQSVISPSRSAQVRFQTSRVWAQYTRLHSYIGCYLHIMHLCPRDNMSWQIGRTVAHTHISYNL